ncbi:MAG: carotenoid biosynthesis protein [Bacteroidales bacterium]|nr:carotenoid biosynthesis protein [Bacteroidales bacterium]
MKKLIQKIRAFNAVPYLAIFYAVGVAGLIIPATRDLFIKLVPLNLLLNITLLFIYHGRLDYGFAWKALVIFFAGIIVEMVGVNTGLIFGSYEYGATLGPEIFHTPVMIGVNWLMLVYSSLVITSRYFDKRYYRVLFAAIAMVIYDFALEPAAIDMDMWDWGGPVPMQNYLAWLVISFLLIWFADFTGFVNRKNKIAVPLFFVQLVFFILLSVLMNIKVLWEF